MNNLLLEQYLASQFKFGFELEAFLKNGYTDVDYDAEDYLHGVVCDLVAWVFDFNENDMDVHYDSSLNANYDEDYPFEWATPVMEFTPSNLKKCINGLNRLLNYEGVYTNETCGFHVHLSFPNISDEDVIWIIAKLAVDNDMRDSLEFFKDGIEFYDNDYASLDVLDSVAEAIEDSDYQRLHAWFTSSKYNVLRIHPQGTLEWRGPRNFLNNGKIENIYGFFALLHKFVRWISSTLRETSIEGISKQNFFKSIYGTEYKSGDTIINDFTSDRLRQLKSKIWDASDEDNATPLIKLITKAYKEPNNKNALKTMDWYIQTLHTMNESGNKLIALAFNYFDSKNLQGEFEFLYKNWSLYPNAMSHLLSYFTYNSLTRLMDLMLRFHDVAHIQSIIDSLPYSDAFLNTYLSLVQQFKNKIPMELWKLELTNEFMILKYADLIDSPSMINEKYLEGEIFRDLYTMIISKRNAITSDDKIRQDLLRKCHDNVVLFSIMEQILTNLLTSDRLTPFSKDFQERFKYEVEILLDILRG